MIPQRLPFICQFAIDQWQQPRLFGTPRAHMRNQTQILNRLLGERSIAISNGNLSWCCKSCEETWRILSDLPFKAALIFHNYDFDGRKRLGTEILLIGFFSLNCFLSQHSISSLTELWSSSYHISHEMSACILVLVSGPAILVWHQARRLYVRWRS